MEFSELKSISFFKDIPEAILSSFAGIFTEEKFHAGDIVFEEDSISDRLFIIKEGEVEIRKATDKAEGKHKLIAVLQKGDFFGEMSVFLDKPRTADAVAKTDVRLVSMSRSDLSDMLSKSPDSAFKVMGLFTSVLTERLINTTRELVTVYETGILVTTSRSSLELSSQVINRVMSSIKSAETGFFVSYNEFNEEYEITEERGQNTLELPYALPADEPLTLWLAQFRETFLAFDTSIDGRIQLSDGSPFKAMSLIASPFFLHDRMLGFLVLINRTNKNAFSYSHLVLLAAIGGYVSVALENLQYMQAEIDRARLSQGKATIYPF